MAGNLDDFLKRAAQRRAQNEMVKREQHLQPSLARRRPEYTDQRRERQVIVTDDDDDVVVAELVSSSPSEAEAYRQFPTSSNGGARGSASHSQGVTASVFEARSRDAAVVAMAERTESELRGNQRETGLQGAASVQRPEEHPLVDIFRNPQSIAQAIVMREILDRPLDRW